MSASDKDQSGDSKRLCLGIITGAHGIHGEVVIKSYTQDPLDIKAYGPLGDEPNKRQFTIAEARLAPKGVVARLKGVEHRNEAEALKGTGLFVEQKMLPEPEEEDQYYFTDLIGLAVVLANQQPYGTVTALHNFGAGDLIEIKPVDDKATQIFPFDKATVPRVDLERGEITLNPPLMIAPEDPPKKST